MTNQIQDLFAENFDFWGRLTAAEKEKLIQNTVFQKYPQGTSIHGKDTDCVGILLVQKGQIRVYILSEDGREITLYRLFQGDICILSASCVLDAITFDVFIDAEEDTDVLKIRSYTFHQLAESNVYVKCFGYQLATRRFSDVMWAMQQILFRGIDSRLATFLWNEVEKDRSTEIKITHEQIARYIGSAREVVSRMLKYFAEEGIVELGRGTIRICDKAKLRKLAVTEDSR